jgi:hypothetical protein
MRFVLGLWLSSCLIWSGTLAAQAPSNQGVLAALPALPVGSLVALLPPAGTPAALNDTANADEAVQTITAALRGKGYRVLAPAQVSAALSGHTPDGCRDAATCDPQLALATLEADAVVSIAVWQRPGWPSQVAVHVRRTQGYGQAEVAVESSGLGAAASSALLAALDDSRRTHEVVVRIESQPSNAHLRVDQTLSARTPARILLLPGNHVLSVEASGYVTAAQYLDVPEQSKEPILVRMQLQRAIRRDDYAGNEAREAQPSLVSPPNYTAAHDHAGAEPSVWNYLVAATLFGVAVPLFTNVIHAAATRGDCVGEIDPRNRCAERVVLGPAFFASLGLASAAVLGGTTFLIVRPLTNGSSSEPRGALVQLQRAF